MERNVSRIDGEVVHLHRLTEEELGSLMLYAVQRKEAAEQDIQTLDMELAHRMGVEL